MRSLFVAMNQHPVLQERLPCALIGRGRRARLNCVAADAGSRQRRHAVASEARIAPRRRGLTAARFKPTPHRVGVGTIARTARARARTAARWPPCDITWRYAKCGTCVPHLSHRCARRITHVMSPGGVRFAHRACAQALRVSVHAAAHAPAPTRTGKHGRVLRTPPRGHAPAHARAPPRRSRTHLACA
jgi:hypothetical protein